MLVLLLLVFGAKRLPELGKSLGEGLRGFKESISGEHPVTHLAEAPRPVVVDPTSAIATATDERPAAPVA